MATIPATATAPGTVISKTSKKMFLKNIDSSTFSGKKPEMAN